MDHVSIVVEDLAAATSFFVDLGCKLEGQGPVSGDWVDRVVGLEGIKSEIAMVRAPDGQGALELVKFHTPASPRGNRQPAPNALGLRHVAFQVDGLDGILARLRARGVELVGTVERYEDFYRLCYVRGPEGVIVELAERIG
jgi:catechol 2,3-dioxygenase-like lactoylglutathione lyase family enzyme